MAIPAHLIGTRRFAEEAENRLREKSAFELPIWIPQDPKRTQHGSKPSTIAHLKFLGNGSHSYSYRATRPSI